MHKSKILFLAASPSDMDQLALNEESRAIGQKLRASERRDSLELITRWAVRPDDLLDYLNEFQPLAGGITPREVIAKFKTMQMVDVCLPTTDGRELVLSRYTQPEPEHRVLLQRLQLRLPEQPPPKITAAQARQQAPATLVV